jgi:hypothetical protein
VLLKCAIKNLRALHKVSKVSTGLSAEQAGSTTVVILVRMVNLARRDSPIKKPHPGGRACRDPLQELVLWDKLAAQKKHHIAVLLIQLAL